MDTKEKNREASRQRSREPERRKRPAPAQAAEDPRKPARKKPAAIPAEQERPRRQSPRKVPAAQQPRKRREQPEQPRQRAAENRSSRPVTTVQRPARTENVQFTPPQGTGPRKSAPQMNVQEAVALRRRQQSQTIKQPEPAKKNALQNFISGVRGSTDPEDLAAKSEQRRKQRVARAEQKRKQMERNDTPAVIYTQPMAFSRDRLLIHLLTVTAVVAALVLGMSVFFKVKNITVAGAETYSTWAVREASGISEGDNLLTFSKAKAGAKIQAELSYVDDVRIGIKLPDTVIIYIEEMDVAYAVKSTNGDWWLINSNGRVVEQTTSAESNNHTQVLGVLLEDPQVGNNAVAANEIPEETLESGEPVPVSVTGDQRLSSALQILKALEANDIVGQAASVDVSYLDDITLWYGSRYEVLLGDTANMEYKIACMNDAILELSEYQSGILDVSFTHWKTEVGYTPFG